MCTGGTVGRRKDWGFVLLSTAQFPLTFSKRVGLEGQNHYHEGSMTERRI